MEQEVRAAYRVTVCLVLFIIMVMSITVLVNQSIHEKAMLVIQEENCLRISKDMDKETRLKLIRILSSEDFEEASRLVEEMAYEQ